MDGQLIGGVLGTVIPALIGIAYYVCSFIIRVKQNGWKSISAEEWKEFGRNIESEIEHLLNGASKVNFHCEHCQKKCDKMHNHVNDLNKNITALRDKWVDRANANSQANTIPPKKSAFAPRDIEPQPTKVSEELPSSQQAEVVQQDVQETQTQEQQPN